MQTQNPKDEEASHPRAWPLLVLFTVSYTFSFVDRQVINLLVEPIKADLDLTDIQISYLQGLMFVIPYVALSIPIGRLVDAVSRISVIIYGILVWSIATMAAGLAGNFGQLAAARSFVGAGEAALTPAVWSVFPDIFGKDRLGLAMSIFSMAPYLGAGLALIAGAQVIEVSRAAEAISLPMIGELKPWQITLIICGAPGFLLALIFAFVKEPKRRQTKPADTETMPIGDVLGFMKQHWKVYLAFLGGAPFLIVMLYSLQAWTPTLLIRVHGWDILDAGRIYGTLSLVSGCLGTLSSPLVAKVMQRLNVKGYPIVTLIGCTALTAFFLFIAGQQDNGASSLVFIGLAGYFCTVPLPQLAVAMQTISPNKMRGVVAGLYVVTGNTMGLGFGPTAVAFLTEKVFADPMAVGVSMGVTGLVAAPIAILIYLNGYKEYRELSSQAQAA